MPNEIVGTKISDLTAASAASDSDVFAGVQSNTTKKFSLSVIKAWVKGWISKADVGLGNVENERQYSSANPQPADKTTISTETATAMSGILQGTGSAVTALPFDSAAIANDMTHVPSSAAVKSAIDASANYGVCDTAAATQTKAVSIPSVTALYEGLRVTVKFENQQNYNGAPKLDVSGTGAVSICSVSGTLASRYEWGIGEVVDFVYDGTYWVIADGGKSSTTYYGATKLSADPTSTSAGLALTPSAISSLAVNSIWSYPVYSKTSTYAVGDRVRYTTGVYECITAIATAESWTAAHWRLIPTLQDQIEQVETDLAGTHITGTTNSTGAVIAKGTFFYLNGTLVQALAQIAINATFTSGTNYEAVTAGGLNSLKADIDSSSTFYSFTCTFGHKYKLTFPSYATVARIFAVNEGYIDIIFGNGWANVTVSDATKLNATFNTDGGYRDFVIENKAVTSARTTYVGVLIPSSTSVTWTDIT
jgi:hypothetical protein